VFYRNEAAKKSFTPIRASRRGLEMRNPPEHYLESCTPLGATEEGLVLRCLAGGRCGDQYEPEAGKGGVQSRYPPALLRPFTMAKPG